MPKKGFTLIELLLTVVVLGILGGLRLSILNPQTFLAKARDSKRISGVRLLKTAIDFYYSDKRAYPDFTSPSVVDWLPSCRPDFGGYSLGEQLCSEYIDTIPSFPSFFTPQGIPAPGTYCAVSGYNASPVLSGYVYMSVGNLTDQEGYVLMASLESPVLSKSTCGTIVTGLNCYCVTN